MFQGDTATAQQSLLKAQEERAVLVEEMAGVKGQNAALQAQLEQAMVGTHSPSRVKPWPHVCIITLLAQSKTKTFTKIRNSELVQTCPHLSF